MNKTVAVDVDGTILTEQGNVRKGVVKMAKDFQKQGYKVIIWSNGGKKHAEEAGKKAGFQNVTYTSKSAYKKIPDIAIDNEERLGKKNIMV